MKKGLLGTIVLIYGIIVALAGLAVILPLGSVGNLLQRLAMYGAIPAVIAGIIAIIINSNKKRAVIGMILAVAGPYIPWLVAVIKSLLK